MAKQKNFREDIIYSTDKNIVQEIENNETLTLPANEQKLNVQLDKKQRRGKLVTVITGFIGTSTDLKDLGKQLKQSCGVGGTTKNGQIEIQGDFREKIKQNLSNNGYTIK